MLIKGKRIFAGETSLYVGADESNWGGNPEIHSAVFSKPIQNEFLFGKFSKSPKSRKAFLESEPSIIVEGRHYTFTKVRQGYFHRRCGEARGKVLVSLIKDELPDSLETLRIFLDGNYVDNIKKEILDVVSCYCGFPYADISLFTKKKLDKKCLLVNRADKISYYINKNIEDYIIKPGPHERILLE